MTRLSADFQEEPQQPEVLKGGQQSDAGSNHNETFELETSAGTSDSSRSSSAGLTDKMASSGGGGGGSIDEYDEKETTIEFSSITSASSSHQIDIHEHHPSAAAAAEVTTDDNGQNQMARNLATHTLDACAKQQQQQQQDGKSMRRQIDPLKAGGGGGYDNAAVEMDDDGDAMESGYANGATRRLNARNGFVISWSNLDYVVESKWYKLTQQRKPILNNLSGSFRSGQLSAVLGPSGAGKSTLVDCLLGKRDRGVTGRTRASFGCASLEEERRRKRPLRIATIPQEDHLLETLTVAETFMFASRLKNAHITYANDEETGEEKVSGNRKPFDHFANAQRVIQQLNLSACAALKCGKLSGGQYKRVSIGQELLSRPDLMILDEPTSGLDSVTCYQTISALRQLVDSSSYPMAIVATIHQPDIEVFNLFHKAYVLASGGRAIYEGPTDGIFRTLGLGMELVKVRREQRPAFGPASAAAAITSGRESELLDSLKMQLDQPPMLAGNPARLIVEVAAGEYGFEITGAMTELQVKSHLRQEEDEERLHSCAGNGYLQSIADVIPMVDAVAASAEKDKKFGLPKFDYIAHNPAKRRANLDRLLDATKATNNNNSLRVYFRHLALHTHRSWLTIMRDPMLFSLQLLLHVAVPLLISYSFMNQLGSDACPRVGPLDVIDEAYREGNVLDELNTEIRAAFENLGYMFFQIYVIIFAAVCVTSLTYPLVMHVLLKEYRNGWYSMSSYFLGRTLADLPVPTFNVILAMAISYHFTGQPLSPYHWRYASVAALTVLATLVAQTQGLMFGAMLMNLPQSAVFVAPASTAPLVVVSGFLLRIKQLPVPLQLLSKLSYFTHLLNGFVISRYGFNRCPCTDDMFMLEPSHQIPAQTRALLDIWVDSFGTEYLQDSANATATKTPPPQVDLIGKMVDTVTRAKTFGYELTDCSQVKPFAMLDYDLDDWELSTCFAALVAMLFGFRWLTYMVLRWKINSSI